MRLIDADKLTKKLVYRQWDIDDDIGVTEDTIRVDEVGNCIDIVKKQKTVEAIPIEWIKRYWSDLIETNSIAKWGIKRMVYEWKDENGQLKESERNIARIIDWREENGTDTI